MDNSVSLSKLLFSPTMYNLNKSNKLSEPLMSNCYVFTVDNELLSLKYRR